jgi:pimeloyl-ACP methyl ester carboxylesterase/membrane protein DedA with SNARE-associated domain
MGIRLPGRLRWWQLYLVLLVLSQVWQAVSSTEAQPDRYQKTLEVPRQTSSTAVDGPPVRIAYRQRGEGRTVVYLHGSPGSGRNSTRLARLLADRYRILAPDLPGFGASSRWLPDYGIEAHARYVLAFMDALEIERAHLIGHSMGSGVAFHISRLAPERVGAIVSYGGIGVQEVEGSGDYYLEHLKYAAGYVLFVAVPEVVPHFGLLGPRWIRHSFIRNFWDTDQRPLRVMLESLEAPLLILHGRRDPLVPALAAREHHRIVRHSELVMMEAGHFMVFTGRGSERLAQEILPFLARHDRPEAVPSRRTVDFDIGPSESGSLPAPLEVRRGMGPWAQIGALVAATFVSEDLTCISAGLLAREARIDFFVAILGCLLGIFITDIWLWGMGRVFGRRVLGWRWISRRVPPATVDRFGERFDRHLGKAVVASRFLPGTRLPMYVAAGIVSKRPAAFIVWLLVAASIWTPILVLAAMIFGPAAAKPFEAILGVGWPSWVGAVLLLFFLLRIVSLLSSWRGRRRLAAAVSKLWRWEFWPVWLFYVPVFPWIAWLMIRYRGITTPTAANPAMPHGGFVGESKGEILSRLPAEWVQPSMLVPPGRPESRLDTMRRHIDTAGWSFPLVLKPDEGQRGIGLKLARDWADVEGYFESNPRAVLVQTYNLGPLEAGVFYYRFPREATGRIFSVTDKAFPEVEGDGRSTLERLILRHPRLRMQWKVFTQRLAGRLSSVPAEGERLRLAVAGNHCQGTMFLDGRQLVTPALERVFDAIAQHYDGFFFGRFDIRYVSAESLRSGRDFKIIELNGVTSESTNVYDPSWSLLRAYRTLGRQWTLAFRIGDANRKNGHRTSSIRALLRAARIHYRHQTAERVAD